MRKFFVDLLNGPKATENNGISMFSWAHILYLVLIIGCIVALSIIFIKKKQTTKTLVVDIVAILVAVAYFGDFFLQPFYDGGTLTENADIILDKFPFHICTVLCPLILISRFSKYCKILKTPVAVLCCVAPLMWLVYPGTALDTDLAFYSYVIFQLFSYHGLVFIYGMVYLLLNEDKLEIKKCYKEAILVLCITLWAAFGNAIYSEVDGHGYNWFFIVDPVFGFIPDAINPFVVPTIIYLSSLIVYGVYYLVMYFINKNKKEEVTE